MSRRPLTREASWGQAKRTCQRLRHVVQRISIKNSDDIHQLVQTKYEFALLQQQQQQRKTIMKNVAISWINNKNAYDICPETWIIESLKTFQISEFITKELTCGIIYWPNPPLKTRSDTKVKSYEEFDVSGFTIFLLDQLRFSSSYFDSFLLLSIWFFFFLSFFLLSFFLLL